MRTTILSLVVAMMIPMVSSAKVDGFNEMISENNQSQQQLHTDLKNQVEETRVAQRIKKEVLDVADYTDVSQVNTPTKKSLTMFQKEAMEYRPSEAQQMKRLANEIKASDAF